MTAELPAWLSMLDSLGEPAWIVAADTLAVAGLNPPARCLLGLNDVAVHDLNATLLIGAPEDMAFWDDVRAGRVGSLASEAMVVATDGPPPRLMPELPTPTPTAELWS